MRIASGVTDQYVYFVAVDATDFTTRETGLSSFTVYRSRNGGTAAAMTTPTINETDTTNMPGVYELLLDEDMTIDSGDETQAMVFHITHAGMAPVTIEIELFRPKITVGNTLDVTATGAAGIDWANVENQSTSVDLSATAISLCDTVTTNTDMRGTDSAALASVCTEARLAELDAANLPADVDAILTDTGTTLPAQISGLNDPTAAAIADAVWDEATAGHVTAGTYGVAATDILTDTGTTIPAQISGLNDPTAAAIADAVWDETLADHLTAGTTGNALNAAGAAGDPWSTSIPGAYGAGSAGYIVGNNLDAAVSSRSTVTEAQVNAQCDTAISDAALATAAALATVDSNVDAILVDTGTTLPAQISGLNDIAVSDILTTQMTESYAADGAAPTLAQALMLIQQMLGDFAISGTTMTVKKVDGATTAATFTLDDATNPTSLTRAT